LEERLISLLSTEEWHARFQEQAGWTETVRTILFDQMALNSTSKMLEVGCGTGAITSSTHGLTSAAIFGADIFLPYLQYARNFDPRSQFIAGNVFHLPFALSSFDATFCHFLLLWLTEPLNALREMVRVTRKGGWILALAEPDYGGRIDHPAGLSKLGKLQALALQHQGANPYMGRNLAHLMVQAGLQEVKAGILGAQWSPCAQAAESASEWNVLLSDLSALINEDQLEELRQLEVSSRKTGTRVLFVPTFYAIGQV
jgi:SAM-dependent methyltransferase